MGNKYNFANKYIYIVEADEAKNLQNKKQIKQNNNSQHYLEMLMDQMSWDRKVRPMDRKSRCVCNDAYVQLYALLITKSGKY